MKVFSSLVGLAILGLLAGCATSGASALSAHNNGLCPSSKVLLSVQRSDGAPMKHRCVLKADIEVLFDREGRETPWN